jgi:hypothetical protein
MMPESFTNQVHCATNQVYGAGTESNRDQSREENLHKRGIISKKFKDAS